MENNEMKALFDRFRDETFSSLPTEAAKDAAIAAFIFGFAKL